MIATNEYFVVKARPKRGKTWEYITNEDQTGRYGGTKTGTLLSEATEFPSQDDAYSYIADQYDDYVYQVVKIINVITEEEIGRYLEAGESR